MRVSDIKRDCGLARERDVGGVAGALGGGENTREGGGMRDKGALDERGM